MATPAKPKSVEELTRVVRNCASWCFIVAALTLINAGLLYSGSDTSFLVGTVIAQAAAQIAANGGTFAKVFAIVLNVGVVAFFIGMGLLARKGHRWAFVLAFMAYGLDTLVLLLAPSFLVLAFHGWVLLSLGSGIVTAGALRKAREIQAAGEDAAAGSAPPPLPSGVEAKLVEKGARDLEEATRRLYAPKHERRRADPREFRGVDQKFYDGTMEFLRARGFRHLGDYEFADLKGTPQDPGCYLRTAVSGDGQVMAAMYHLAPKKWWLKLMIAILSRGGFKVLDLETELSDGTFVTTSNAQKAATVKLPPTIVATHLPPATQPEDLLAMHADRVAAELRARPGVSVRLVTTLEECHAAQDRQDAMKAAFRSQLGGITREELLAHADSPAKRDAAEMLAARLEMRKTEQPPAGTAPLE